MLFLIHSAVQLCASMQRVSATKKTFICILLWIEHKKRHQKNVQLSVTRDSRDSPFVCKSIKSCAAMGGDEMEHLLLNNSTTSWKTGARTGEGESEIKTRFCCQPFHSLLLWVLCNFSLSKQIKDREWNWILLTTAVAYVDSEFVGKTTFHPWCCGAN